MSVIEILASIAMFFITVGIAYAAYSYKLNPCDKKQ